MQSSNTWPEIHIKGISNILQTFVDLINNIKIIESTIWYVTFNIGQILTISTWWPYKHTNLWKHLL